MHPTALEWAQQAARTLAPAPTWRARLAESIQEGSTAKFATVFTCPPSQPLEAHGNTAPPEFNDLVQKICARFLPRVEKGKDTAVLVPQQRTKTHAPLEVAVDLRLASRLRRELLAPHGVDGMLTTHLVSEAGDLLGWIAVGDARPSDELLAEFGESLDGIASAAVSTLEMAIKLAAGCGSVVLRAPSDRTRHLSAREREVVRLIAKGFTDVAVARTLGISDETVGSHLRRIFSKLSVHSRTELIQSAGALAAWDEQTSS